MARNPSDRERFKRRFKLNPSLSPEKSADNMADTYGSKAKALKVAKGLLASAQSRQYVGGDPKYWEKVVARLSKKGRAKKRNPAAAWKKGRVKVAVKRWAHPSAGTHEYEQGYILHQFGVFKQGGSWSVTHRGTGLRLTHVATLKDGKALVEALPLAVQKAKTRAAINSHMEVIMAILADPPTAPRAADTRAPRTGGRVASRRLEVIRILKDNGLISLGSYYGRSGEYFGLRYDRSPYGLAVRVARNYVGLQHRQVEARHGKQTTRWVMYGDDKLVSKVTDAQLLRWVEQVKGSQPVSITKAQQRRPRIGRRR